MTGVITQHPETVTQTIARTGYRLKPWKMIFFVICAAGIYATYLRIRYGLGATTNLSDAFPWGVWKCFNVLCGIALAAGGFTITGTVHVLNLERFKPIVRPMVLIAFLGYSGAGLALVYDLGRSLWIWHPIFMWNIHSVLFEVAWCVMLYLTVLTFELSPAVCERMKWNRLLRIVKALTPPLVIFGVMLSTLHQSSLGTLFVIVPHRLHPLWYSPLLPLFFYISAIGLGLAMVIFSSFLSRRAFGRSVDFLLLQDIARAMVVILGAYALLRFEDIQVRHAGAYLWQANLTTGMFWLEMLLGTLLPVAMLSVPKIRQSQTGMFIGSVMVVLGFVANRVNVSITGIQATTPVTYMPKWPEVAISAFIIALGFAGFALAAKYLPIFADPSKPGASPLGDLERAA
jgi:Ni/Fe-hydrogenase subunit HybB-like protein